MRKFVIVFTALILMFGGSLRVAYAVNCAEDTLADRFGDWFGGIGKSEKRKNRSITARRANRLAECAEKQAKEAAATAQNPAANRKNK